ncbi:hypothetical protein TBLA_0E01900 [Henningerozyma blattae CBS 6284]|uniref:Zn(2)-C6 fungal-type domain-containing protein n=1 Tax=Henningerozyma blattae (strain ATCC 34711 / CBS 6284 / DSM 70876 / NBRC 10599 / NRRL Y-10934 / UCD 77-7) TaxID=1071380 RepID=I2H4E2_HENB6|nr:hypothetical protein TBLA_0E01900 [Tetrapisispora blattae CBS 6284]CCH61244.1 hypothetical protein TBLA_0E01900 [Tetrapisispora blattae CBS 6284]
MNDSNIVVDPRGQKRTLNAEIPTSNLIAASTSTLNSSSNISLPVTTIPTNIKNEIEAPNNLNINILSRASGTATMNPTTTILPSTTGVKRRLACSSCRRRRKKCDMQYPCGNCVHYKDSCNINEEDMRRQRHSSTYVKSLENQILLLQKSLEAANNKLSLTTPNNISTSSTTNITTDTSTTVNNLSRNGNSSNTSLSSLPPVSPSFLNSNSPTTSTTTPSTTIKKLVPTERKWKNLVTGSVYPDGPVSYKPKINKGRNALSISSLISSGSNITSSCINTGTISSNTVTNIDSNDGVGISTTNKNGPHANNTILSSTSTSSLEDLTTTTPNGSISSTNSEYQNNPNGITYSSKSQTLEERISDLKTTKIVRTTSNKDANQITNDPKIIRSLSNFYKWLYAGLFTFVHRESFLYGFFNHAKNNYEDSEYCSIELIYSMCAIGSRLVPELQEYSEIYYEKSKTILLKLVFDDDNTAHITTVQALFCLAFYELGKGNNQLSWYFSGLAIRVGYEMGFQLDPQVWYTDDENDNVKLTKSELEIRSRIYWGCYIADHFICLMLGKTSTLSVSNSTIPESDELPEVDGTEDFRFVGKHILQISLPLKNLIILSRIVEIFTSKIFIETDEINLKLMYLQNFNLKVYNWRQSLPDLLKWSNDLIQDQDVSTDPTISYFWYHYYLVRLIFNKPFMEDNEESRNVVIEVIEDLIILFDNFKYKFDGFLKANLYQLYLCLLATRCIKTLMTLTDIDHKMQKVWPNQLKYFSNILLKELTPAYELANRMEEDVDFELEQDKHTATQVNTNTYTYDFSLSNEIDDLIRDLFGPNLWNETTNVSHPTTMENPEEL